MRCVTHHEHLRIPARGCSVYLWGRSPRDRGPESGFVAPSSQATQVSAAGISKLLKETSDRSGEWQRLRGFCSDHDLCQTSAPMMKSLRIARTADSGRNEVRVRDTAVVGRLLACSHVGGRAVRPIVDSLRIGRCRDKMPSTQLQRALVILRCFLPEWPKRFIVFARIT